VDRKDDAVLIKDILEGNASRFRTLIERYKDDVFRLSFYILGNFHDAEDISQEVFLTVFRKLDSFDGRFAFKNWLLKIAHNKCINFINAKKMTSVTLDEGLKEKLAARRRMSPIAHDRVMQLVREAVAKLDPQSRSVFTLFHFDGLSYKALAELTQKSTGNLKVIVHRARKAVYESVCKKNDLEEEA